MYRPLIYSDFPDLDVIRVGDTYYMVSTTMHMFPGGDIYRSKDLIKWELCCHMYEKLDETPAQQLKDGNIYGQGMWAACIRFHDGRYHVFFVCNDTHKTYHFTAVNPEGPWTWNEVKGFYHDCSVLFDEDRVFIVYGNRQIHLTELNKALDGPEPGGIDEVILTDLPSDKMMLGFEGSHFYRINGKYYIFMIHWAQGGRRTQACYMSDCITGPYTGGDVLDCDMGFFNQGVAQGGIVDSPDGSWHGMLFQDHGAVGRVPVLCDVTWKDDFPVFAVANLPEQNMDDISALFVNRESFTKPFSQMWQFNHQPDSDACKVSAEGLILKLDKACDMEHARNTLTTRAFGPRCKACVSIDASGLKTGGRAGFGVLMGCFAGVFVERREDDELVLCIEYRAAEKWALKSFEPVKVQDIMRLDTPDIRIKIDMDFRDMTDTVAFSVLKGETETPLGYTHRLQYRLDHFMGARIAMYGYDTMNEGSKACFRDYNCDIIT